MERTCSVAGCTKKLNAANQSGRCSGHWYVKKTETAGDGKTKRRAPAKAKANGHADPETHGTHGTNGHADQPLAPFRAPMMVTPEFLDRFWNSLPLDEKVRILERV